MRTTKQLRRGTMSIQKKLKQYHNSKYVPGEKRSKEYDKKIQREKRLTENLQLLDELNRDLPEALTLNRCDLRLAEHLVKVFNNNMKYLLRQGKTETILLAFIFYLRKIENPLIKIEDYTTLRKYGLNNNNYSLIISRVCMYYMMNTPLSINETTDYDHDLLLRNNGE